MTCQVQLNLILRGLFTVAKYSAIRKLDRSLIRTHTHTHSDIHAHNYLNLKFRQICFKTNPVDDKHKNGEKICYGRVI